MRRCNNHPSRVSSTCTPGADIDLLFALVHLPVVTLRVSAFRSLVISTALCFTGSLICLKTTLLFLQIISARLGFAAFKLFLSMRFIGYALLSHNFSFRM